MGGTVSKGVYRKTARAVKNINIENRAHKAIDQHKNAPVVAPRHPSTVELLKNMSAGECHSLFILQCYLFCIFN